jgi:hypothetical protein
MELKFSDGTTIDTTGPLRKLQLEDGWYVVGNGFCIRVADEGEADETIVKMSDRKQVRYHEEN